MRPKKIRWVCCPPGERCFRPIGKPVRRLQGVILSLDEMEAVRLADLQGFEQERVARWMRVHRSTVSRILASARRKIGDALVNCKAIKVEGGCCKIKKRN
ncbi:MAG: DUF134 domain-containing protein [Candidatus Omnitrophica bacterium]|nr:DUF134 domain-containing protein [Candidatus Omnitrophota bacterium]